MEVPKTPADRRRPAREPAARGPQGPQKSPEQQLLDLLTEGGLEADSAQVLNG